MATTEQEKSVVFEKVDPSGVDVLPYPVPVTDQSIEVIGLRASSKDSARYLQKVARGLAVATVDAFSKMKVDSCFEMRQFLSKDGGIGEHLELLEGVSVKVPTRKPTIVVFPIGLALDIIGGVAFEGVDGQEVDRDELQPMGM